MRAGLRGLLRKGRATSRSCGAIGLKGVTEVSPLEAIAGEYTAPDVNAFSREILRAADELLSAGALDAGNGAALDARVDFELERVCAQYARQHAENAVMLDRIAAALSARLRELEVREEDVARRLGEAQQACAKAHEAGSLPAGATKGADAPGARPTAAHRVVSIVSREEAPASDLKEAGNA